MMSNSVLRKAHDEDLLMCRNGQTLFKIKEGRVGKHVSPLKVFTPYELASPTTKVYADRFIPLRTSEHSVNLIRRSVSGDNSPNQRGTKSAPSSAKKTSPYQVLLSEQLLESMSERKVKRTLFANQKVLSFSRDKLSEDLENSDPSSEIYSPSGVTLSTPAQNFVSQLVRNKVPRIPTSPMRILDAPSLENDFYLNLLDYSAKNVIALALGSYVYLWSDGKSSPFHKSGTSCPHPTSLAFNREGTQLGMGSSNGSIQVRDVETKGGYHYCDKAHKSRVGVLAWKDNLLFSGSKSGLIMARDTRMDPSSKAARAFTSHSQEVCGLKCYYDGSLLASGCNDNKVLIWDIGMGKTVHTFLHKAAVRAISWNPHSWGTLTTGGGTSDQSVYHWNTFTGQLRSKTFVGSQITGVFWCHHADYYVTTQGYSTNDIIVWNGATNEKIAVLEGHNSRVIYAALAPDSTTLVTAAGEPCSTLKFWNVFPKKDFSKQSVPWSALNLFQSR